MSFNDNIELGNKRGPPGRVVRLVQESDTGGIKEPQVFKQHGGSTRSSNGTQKIGSEARNGETEGGWARSQAKDKEIKMSTKEEAKGIATHGQVPRSDVRNAQASAKSTADETMRIERTEDEAWSNPDTGDHKNRDQEESKDVPQGTTPRTRPRAEGGARGDKTGAMEDIAHPEDRQEEGKKSTTGQAGRAQTVRTRAPQVMEAKEHHDKTMEEDGRDVKLHKLQQEHRSKQEKEGNNKNPNETQDRRARASENKDKTPRHKGGKSEVSAASNGTAPVTAIDSTCTDNRENTRVSDTNPNYTNTPYNTREERDSIALGLVANARTPFDPIDSTHQTKRIPSGSTDTGRNCITPTTPAAQLLTQDNSLSLKHAHLPSGEAEGDGTTLPQDSKAGSKVSHTHNKCIEETDRAARQGDVNRSRHEPSAHSVADTLTGTGAGSIQAPEAAHIGAKTNDDGPSVSLEACFQPSPCCDGCGARPQEKALKKARNVGLVAQNCGVVEEAPQRPLVAGETTALRSSDCRESAVNAAAAYSNGDRGQSVASETAADCQLNNELDPELQSGLVFEPSGDSALGRDVSAAPAEKPACEGDNSLVCEPDCRGQPTAAKTAVDCQLNNELDPELQSGLVFESRGGSALGRDVNAASAAYNLTAEEGKNDHCDAQDKTIDNVGDKIAAELWRNFRTRQGKEEEEKTQEEKTQQRHVIEEEQRELEDELERARAQVREIQEKIRTEKISRNFPKQKSRGRRNKKRHSKNKNKVSMDKEEAIDNLDLDPEDAARIAKLLEQEEENQGYHQRFDDVVGRDESGEITRSTKMGVTHVLEERRQLVGVKTPPHGTGPLQNKGKSRGKNGCKPNKNKLTEEQRNKKRTDERKARAKKAETTERLEARAQYKAQRRFQREREDLDQFVVELVRRLRSEETSYDIDSSSSSAALDGWDEVKVLMEAGEEEQQELRNRRARFQDRRDKADEMRAQNRKHRQEQEEEDRLKKSSPQHNDNAEVHDSAEKETTQERTPIEQWARWITDAFRENKFEDGTVGTVHHDTRAGQCSTVIDTLFTKEKMDTVEKVKMELEEPCIPEVAIYCFDVRERAQGTKPKKVFGAEEVAQVLLIARWSDTTAHCMTVTSDNAQDAKAWEEKMDIGTDTTHETRGNRTFFGTDDNKIRIQGQGSEAEDNQYSEFEKDRNKIMFESSVTSTLIMEHLVQAYNTQVEEEQIILSRMSEMALRLALYTEDDQHVSKWKYIQRQCAVAEYFRIQDTGPLIYRLMTRCRLVSKEANDYIGRRWTVAKQTADEEVTPLFEAARTLNITVPPQGCERYYAKYDQCTTELRSIFTKPYDKLGNMLQPIRQLMGIHTPYRMDGGTVLIGFPVSSRFQPIRRREGRDTSVKARDKDDTEVVNWTSNTECNKEFGRILRDIAGIENPRTTLRDILYNHILTVRSKIPLREDPNCYRDYTPPIPQLPLAMIDPDPAPYSHWKYSSQWTSEFYEPRTGQYSMGDQNRETEEEWQERHATWAAAGMTGAEVPLPPEEYPGFYRDGGLARLAGPGCHSQDTTRLWPYLWRNMKAKYRERISRACSRGKRHPESHTREAVEEEERLSMQFAEHIACMGLQQFDDIPQKQEELIMLIIDEEEMFNIEYNNEAFYPFECFQDEYTERAWRGLKPQNNTETNQFHSSEEPPYKKALNPVRSTTPITAIFRGHTLEGCQKELIERNASYTRFYGEPQRIEQYLDNDVYTDIDTCLHFIPSEVVLQGVDIKCPMTNRFHRQRVTFVGAKFNRHTYDHVEGEDRFDSGHINSCMIQQAELFRGQDISYRHLYYMQEHEEYNEKWTSKLTDFASVWDTEMTERAKRTKQERRGGRNRKRHSKNKNKYDSDAPKRNYYRDLWRKMKAYDEQNGRLIEESIEECKKMEKGTERDMYVLLKAHPVQEHDPGTIFVKPVSHLEKNYCDYYNNRDKQKTEDSCFEEYRKNKRAFEALMLEHSEDGKEEDLLEEAALTKQKLFETTVYKTTTPGRAPESDTWTRYMYHQQQWHFMLLEDIALSRATQRPPQVTTPEDTTPRQRRWNEDKLISEGKEREIATTGEESNELRLRRGRWSESDDFQTHDEWLDLYDSLMPYLTSWRDWHDKTRRLNGWVSNMTRRMKLEALNTWRAVNSRNKRVSMWKHLQDDGDEEDEDEEQGPDGSSGEGDNSEGDRTNESTTSPTTSNGRQQWTDTGMSEAAKWHNMLQMKQTLEKLELWRQRRHTKLEISLQVTQERPTNIETTWCRCRGWCNNLLIEDREKYTGLCDDCYGAICWGCGGGCDGVNCGLPNDMDEREGGIPIAFSLKELEDTLTREHKETTTEDGIKSTWRTSYCRSDKKNPTKKTSRTKSEPLGSISREEMTERRVNCDERRVNGDFTCGDEAGDMSSHSGQGSGSGSGKKHAGKQPSAKRTDKSNKRPHPDWTQVALFHGTFNLTSDGVAVYWDQDDELCCPKNCENMCQKCIDTRKARCIAMKEVAAKAVKLNKEATEYQEWLEKQEINKAHDQNPTKRIKKSVRKQKRTTMELWEIALGHAMEMQTDRTSRTKFECICNESEQEIKCYICRLKTLGVGTKTWSEIENSLHDGHVVIIATSGASSRSHKHYVMLHRDKDKGNMINPDKNNFCLFSCALEINRLSLDTALDRKVHQQEIRLMGTTGKGQGGITGENFTSLLRVANMPEYIQAESMRYNGREANINDGRREEWPDIDRFGTDQKGLEEEGKAYQSLGENIQRGYKCTSATEGAWIPDWAINIGVTVHIYGCFPSVAGLDTGEGILRRIRSPTTYATPGEQDDPEYTKPKRRKTEEGETAGDWITPLTAESQGKRRSGRVAQKTDANTEAAESRAIKVGVHLWEMYEVLKICDEYNNPAASVHQAVTEEARKELDRRGEEHERGFTAQKRDEINRTQMDEGAELLDAKKAWTERKDQFLDHTIEVPKQRKEETELQWHSRCAQAFLPAAKHWKHICCACGNAVHRAINGICFSPHAAAVADAVTRTAFTTDIDNSLSEAKSKKKELCIRTCTKTGAFLNKLQEKVRTRDIVYLYPAVGWGEEVADTARKSQANMMEVTETVLFAIEKGVSGESAIIDATTMDVLPVKTYGVPIDTEVTYRTGNTGTKIKAELSLRFMNETFGGILTEGNNTIVFVNSWQGYQMQMTSSGMIATREGQDPETGDQAYLFYGESQYGDNKWKHREKSLTKVNPRTLPTPSTQEGREEIARQAIEFVRRLTGETTETYIYFDPEAPIYFCGADTQYVKEGMQIGEAEPMLGVHYSSTPPYNNPETLTRKQVKQLEETLEQIKEIGGRKLTCADKKKEIRKVTKDIDPGWPFQKEHMHPCSNPGCIRGACFVIDEGDVKSRILRAAGEAIKYTGGHEALFPTHGYCINRTEQRGEEDRKVLVRKFDYKTGCFEEQETERARDTDLTMDQAMSQLGTRPGILDVVKMHALLLALNGQWQEKMEIKELENRVATKLAEVYEKDMKNIHRWPPYIETGGTEVLCGNCHTILRTSQRKSCGRCKRKTRTYSCTKDCAAMGVAIIAQKTDANTEAAESRAIKVGVPEWCLECITKRVRNETLAEGWVEATEDEDIHFRKMMLLALGTIRERQNAAIDPNNASEDTHEETGNENIEEESAEDMIEDRTLGSGDDMMEDKIPETCDEPNTTTGSGVATNKTRRGAKITSGTAAKGTTEEMPGKTKLDFTKIRGQIASPEQVMEPTHRVRITKDAVSEAKDAISEVKGRPKRVSRPPKRIQGEQDTQATTNQEEGKGRKIKPKENHTLGKKIKSKGNHILTTVPLANNMTITPNRDRKVRGGIEFIMANDMEYKIEWGPADEVKDRFERKTIKCPGLRKAVEKQNKDIESKIRQAVKDGDTDSLSYARDILPCYTSKEIDTWLKLRTDYGRAQSKEYCLRCMYIRTSNSSFGGRNATKQCALKKHQCQKCFFNDLDSFRNLNDFWKPASEHPAVNQALPEDTDITIEQGEEAFLEFGLGIAPVKASPLCYPRSDTLAEPTYVNKHFEIHRRSVNVRDNSNLDIFEYRVNLTRWLTAQCEDTVDSESTKYWEKAQETYKELWNLCMPEDTPAEDNTEFQYLQQVALNQPCRRRNTQGIKKWIQEMEIRTQAWRFEPPHEQEALMLQHSEDGGCSEIIRTTLGLAQRGSVDNADKLKKALDMHEQHVVVYYYDIRAIKHRDQVWRTKTKGRDAHSRVILIARWGDKIAHCAVVQSRLELTVAKWDEIVRGDGIENPRTVQESRWFIPYTQWTNKDGFGDDNFTIEGTTDIEEEWNDMVDGIIGILAAEHMNTTGKFEKVARAWNTRQDGTRGCGGIIGLLALNDGWRKLCNDISRTDLTIVIPDDSEIWDEGPLGAKTLEVKRPFIKRYCSPITTNVTIPMSSGEQRSMEQARDFRDREMHKGFRTHTPVIQESGINGHAVLTIMEAVMYLIMTEAKEVTKIPASTMETMNRRFEGYYIASAESPSREVIQWRSEICNTTSRSEDGNTHPSGYDREREDYSTAYSARTIRINRAAGSAARWICNMEQKEIQNKQGAPSETEESGLTNEETPGFDSAQSTPRSSNDDGEGSTFNEMNQQQKTKSGQEENDGETTTENESPISESQKKFNENLRKAKERRRETEQVEAMMKKAEEDRQSELKKRITPEIIEASSGEGEARQFGQPQAEQDKIRETNFNEWAEGWRTEQQDDNSIGQQMWTNDATENDTYRRGSYSSSSTEYGPEQGKPRQEGRDLGATAEEAREDMTPTNTSQELVDMAIQIAEMQENEQKNNDEIRNLKMQNFGLEAKLETSQGKLEEETNTGLQLQERLEEEVKRVESLTEEAEQQNRAAKEKQQIAENKITETMDAANTLVSDYEHVIGKLEEQVKQATKNTDAGTPHQQEAHREAMQKVMDEIQQLEKEAEQNTTDNRNKAQELERTKQELRTANETITELKEKESTEGVSDQESTDREIEDLTAQIERTQGELEKTRAIAKGRLLEIETLSAQTSNMSTELDTIRVKLSEAKDNTNEELLRINEELKLEMQTQQEQAEKDMQALKERVAASKTEKKDLEEQLEKEIKSMTEERQAHIQTTEKMEAEILKAEDAATSMAMTNNFKEDQEKILEILQEFRQSRKNKVEPDTTGSQALEALEWYGSELIQKLETEVSTLTARTRLLARRLAQNTQEGEETTRQDKWHYTIELAMGQFSMQNKSIMSPEQASGIDAEITNLRDNIEKQTSVNTTLCRTIRGNTNIENSTRASFLTILKRARSEVDNKDKLTPGKKNKGAKHNSKETVSRLAIHNLEKSSRNMREATRLITELLKWLAVIKPAGEGSREQGSAPEQAIEPAQESQETIEQLKKKVEALQQELQDVDTLQANEQQDRRGLEEKQNREMQATRDECETIKKKWELAQAEIDDLKKQQVELFADETENKTFTKKTKGTYKQSTARAKEKITVKLKTDKTNSTPPTKQPEEEECTEERNKELEKKLEELKETSAKEVEEKESQITTLTEDLRTQKEFEATMNNSVEELKKTTTKEIEERESRIATLTENLKDQTKQSKESKDKLERLETDMKKQKNETERQMKRLEGEKDHLIKETSRLEELLEDVKWESPPKIEWLENNDGRVTHAVKKTTQKDSIARICTVHLFSGRIEVFLSDSEQTLHSVFRDTMRSRKLKMISTEENATRTNQDMQNLQDKWQQKTKIMQILDSQETDNVNIEIETHDSRKPKRSVYGTVNGTSGAIFQQPTLEHGTRHRIADTEDAEIQVEQNWYRVEDIQEYNVCTSEESDEEQDDKQRTSSRRTPSTPIRTKDTTGKRNSKQKKQRNKDRSDGHLTTPTQRRTPSAQNRSKSRRRHTTASCSSESEDNEHTDESSGSPHSSSSEEHERKRKRREPSQSRSRRSDVSSRSRRRGEEATSSETKHHEQIMKKVTDKRIRARLRDIDTRTPKGKLQFINIWQEVASQSILFDMKATPWSLATVLKEMAPEDHKISRVIDQIIQDDGKDMGSYEFKNCVDITKDGYQRGVSDQIYHAMTGQQWNDRTKETKRNLCTDIKRTGESSCLEGYLEQKMEDLLEEAALTKQKSFETAVDNLIKEIGWETHPEIQAKMSQIQDIYDTHNTPKERADALEKTVKKTYSNVLSAHRRAIEAATSKKLTDIHAVAATWLTREYVGSELYETIRSTVNNTQTTRQEHDTSQRRYRKPRREANMMEEQADEETEKALVRANISWDKYDDICDEAEEERKWAEEYGCDGHLDFNSQIYSQICIVEDQKPKASRQFFTKTRNGHDRKQPASFTHRGVEKVDPRCQDMTDFCTNREKLEQICEDRGSREFKEHKKEMMQECEEHPKQEGSNYKTHRNYQCCSALHRLRESPLMLITQQEKLTEWDAMEHATREQRREQRSRTIKKTEDRERERRSEFRDE